MDLELPYRQVSTPQEAFEKVKANITPKTMEKFQVKADFSYEEDKKIIHADGKGFHLVAECLEGHVSIHLKLSLILKPLKKKVLEIIEKEFSKVV